MTYAIFLLLFLGVPIVLLALAVSRRCRRRHLWACGIVCGLAFAYTSPWDNHAAKEKLWTFDPVFAPVSHFVLYLPWEEYVFYFAQGIFICLLLVLLSRYLKPSHSSKLNGHEL